MKIKVKSSLGSSDFIYECPIFPRIGESIIKDKKVYIVRSVYYIINEKDVQIEVDVEYRFKM